MKQFQLKQIVKSPTRQDVILDLVLTNMKDYYDTPQILPPFGLSDHNTVVISSRIRPPISSSKKTIIMRDKRPSQKVEMGRYLGSVDWSSLLASSTSCEDQLSTFNEIIHVGQELLMPVRKVNVNLKDAPWMNEKLKSLILNRQQAFCKHGVNSVIFRFYRNAVNRERKKCKREFYSSKVQHLKGVNPKIWWKEVKRISGIDVCKCSILDQLDDPRTENMSKEAIANTINEALLEP